MTVKQSLGVSLAVVALAGSVALAVYILRRFHGVAEFIRESRDYADEDLAYDDGSF